MESLECLSEELLSAQNLGVDVRYIGVIEEDAVGVSSGNFATNLARVKEDS